MPTPPDRFNNLHTSSESSVVVEQDSLTAPLAASTTEDSSVVSPEEEAEFRRQKLAAIRSAIEAGAYDSDDLLEQAMLKMRASIERGEKPQ